MGRPLVQINLVPTDIAGAVKFYALLGWDFEVTPDGAHASLQAAPGVLVELDTDDFAAVWNTGSVTNAGGTVLTVSVDGRAAVDKLFDDAVDAGHRGLQRPYDAFWGARFAIIADPDGHQIGIMSPSDESARYWPPRSAAEAPE